jgi:hypothetical protein
MRAGTFVSIGRGHNRMDALWKTFSENQKRVYLNSFTFFAVRVFPFWKLLNKKQKKKYAETYAGWRRNWDTPPERSPFTDAEWEIAVMYEWARSMEQFEDQANNPADAERYGSASWRRQADQEMDREDGNLIAKRRFDPWMN